MLNKELLLVAGTSTAEGHIKLTVEASTESDITYYGYRGNPAIGSVSRIPQWFNKDNVLLTLSSFLATNTGAISVFDDYHKEPKSVSVTVLEKGRTVNLQSARVLTSWGLFTEDLIFTASDVGKTFTLVFDPPPDSYA